MNTGAAIVIKFKQGATLSYKVRADVSALLQISPAHARLDLNMPDLARGTAQVALHGQLCNAMHEHMAAGPSPGQYNFSVAVFVPREALVPGGLPPHSSLPQIWHTHGTNQAAVPLAD